MKIGILTFFRTPNYGAMLQAYSLFSAIRGLGHSVEFIDYAFTNSVYPSLFQCFKTRHRSVFRSRLRRYTDFAIVRAFSDSLPRSLHLKSASAFRSQCDKYECIVVGSDQVWNPMGVAGQLPDIVFLSKTPESLRKIAYAPSFSVPEWHLQNTLEIGNLLSDFSAISVREDSGAGIVEHLTGKCPPVVLDPTLLHGAEFYASLANRKAMDEAHFLFKYVIPAWTDGSVETMVSEEVCRSLGIISTLTDTGRSPGWSGAALTAIGRQGRISVEHWLSRIKNASFVVTNSFHGTVFAILFHRPFLAIPIRGKFSGMNERVFSLLHRTGLDARLVNQAIPTEIKALSSTPIDWRTVDEKLRSMREQSLLFLKTALADEPRKK